MSKDWVFSCPGLKGVCLESRCQGVHALLNNKPNSPRILVEPLILRSRFISYSLRVYRAVRLAVGILNYACYAVHCTAEQRQDHSLVYPNLFKFMHFLPTYQLGGQIPSFEHPGGTRSNKHAPLSSQHYTLLPQSQPHHSAFSQS